MNSSKLYAKVDQSIEVSNKYGNPSEIIIIIKDQNSTATIELTLQEAVHIAKDIISLAESSQK